MTANGLGLGEEGDLEAQMLNKPQMFIEIQMFNLALLPLFRQTLVVGSLFVIHCKFPKQFFRLVHHLKLCLVLWQRLLISI